MKFTKELTTFNNLTFNFFKIKCTLGVLLCRLDDVKRFSARNCPMHINNNDNALFPVLPL